MKQLSKKEYKYRYKIIYENHFKKDKQTFLDKYVQRRLLTYQTLYLNYYFLDNMLTQYHLSKINDTAEYCVKAVKSASKAMQMFAANITKLSRQLGDYENIVT